MHYDTVHYDSGFVHYDCYSSNLVLFAWSAIVLIAVGAFLHSLVAQIQIT